MVSKDSAGNAAERYMRALEMGRRGLMQEYTTETGEIVRTGRPRKIDTLETFERAMNDYLIYMEDVNRDAAERGDKPYIMTIAGFCVFCGISRDELSHYLYQNSNNKAYWQAVKRLQDIILTGLQQAGFNSDAAVIPLMAELNNSHGYTNAPQVVRHEISADLPTVEDVRRRIPTTDGE